MTFVKDRIDAATEHLLHWVAARDRTSLDIAIDRNCSSAIATLVGQFNQGLGGSDIIVSEGTHIQTLYLLWPHIQSVSIGFLGMACQSVQALSHPGQYSQP